jgi:hypothetical protein
MNGNYFFLFIGESNSKRMIDGSKGTYSFRRPVTGFAIADLIV